MPRKLLLFARKVKNIRVLNEDDNSTSLSGTSAVYSDKEPNPVNPVDGTTRHDPSDDSSAMAKVGKKRWRGGGGPSGTAEASAKRTKPVASGKAQGEEPHAAE